MPCVRRGPAGAHAGLVNHVQSADAEDPWMQREWAATLASEGRAKEALMHLQVASCGAAVA